MKTKVTELIEFMEKFPTLHATEYLRYTKSLAVEEVKEKPTAPASLVEEVMEWDGYYCEGELPVESREVLWDILSHYRPQTDVVGHLKELVKNTKSQEEIIEVWQIEEIIRKAEGEK